MNKLSETEIVKFRNNLCSTAHTFSRKVVVYTLQSVFINRFKLSKDSKNLNKQIAYYYNLYADRLNCTISPHERSRNPENFLKRAVSLGKYETILYDFLLSDPEKIQINVNSVEVINGKKETLLDYLNTILATPAKRSQYVASDLEDLRSWIIDEYGAKTAEELKN